MGAQPSENGKVNRILNMAPAEDRIMELEKKVISMCTHFNNENERIMREMDVLKQAVFNRVLSPKEIAGVLKIKESSVRKNMEVGALEGQKVGGRWKTTLKAVFDFMKKKPGKYGSELSLMEVVNYFS